MNGFTKVFDALKSRYQILSRPPSDAGRLDNDGRCLTQLWVFGNRELDDDPQHSHLPDSFSKPMIDLNTIDPQMMQEKLISALSALSFRGQHVLVQFWSPVTVRNRCLLTTWDQPFALGAVDDEGLYSYRLDSEQRTFVADGEHKKELDPPARVYSQKLPEWSFDIQTFPTSQSVQCLDASYNIHGYILLPVTEPDSERCVGVLELVISSNYVDYAFEVEEVSRALKEENLKSPNVSEDPTFSIKASFPEKVIEGVDIIPGTIQKKRKRNIFESPISLEEIKEHFGKSVEDTAAILNVSRSTLKCICRNFGMPGWPFRQDNDGPVGFDETSDLYREAVKMNVPEDGLLLRSGAAESRWKRIRTRLAMTNPPYGNGSDERLGTSTRNISTHRKHCTTNDNWTIEATYRENTMIFLFRLSDGLGKLEEVVATRSRLTLGSFKLKYADNEGDIIWIACDKDLMALGGEYRQSDSTVIKLLVLPVVHQSPESNSDA